ncbi:MULTISPECIES: hypothetical protein [Streptomyces]|uniref:Allene oxide cyclase barrel-like domain-containing protein n=1 Tax=Streptomyces solicathayae TaxID=3081768 RepID=A0ABZ0LQL8_9ACTN|nr:hypothetical protein [Streptomyces sp. HUAS YS2]WOX21783.1 hypothetical protein R2D22_10385 [Streptomyces sp. HUAS YS2]
MLGDLIGEEQGQTTGMRVLSTDGGHPVIEASFQATGTMLGVEIEDLGTYESVLRADGTLWGEGQGFTMTKEGETVTWHGSGVGTFDDTGAVDWRGALYFETTADRFSRLNGVAGVYEFHVTADGKATAKLWEWK